MKHSIVITALFIASTAVAADKPERKVITTLTPLGAFTIAGADLRKDGTVVTGSIIDPMGDSEPDQRPADALNTTRIECYPQSTRYCVESISSVMNDQFLTTNIALWEITSAEKDKLVARSDGLCASNTLTINNVTKSVTQIKENGGAGDYNSCLNQKINGVPMYTPLLHPVVWVLVDGQCLPFLDSRFSVYLKERNMTTPQWKTFADKCKSSVQGNH